MAIIKPFKSVRYHSPKVDTITKFLAPPYDVISEQDRDELYDRSEHNIVRIDFPKDPAKGDKYEQSAALLDKWEQEELLVIESRPAIYVLEDYFIDWHGYRRIRRGFIAVLKVEDFNKGTVFPHEKTFAKHKQDRMNMLKATQAQFNPVFAFYSDGENAIRPVLKNVVDHNLPDWNFRFDDGATRTLWTVTDHRFIDQIIEGMKSRKVFIADGHHRYETALEYAKIKDKELGIEGSDAPHQYALMYFVCTGDEGLSILATHRLLKDIPGYDRSKVLEKLKNS
ncbi:MAG TPA: DUF1015 domain-containing protein, partial [bacterium]|nr:DUF1015 domain-containing protein [bacterium]